MIPVANFLVSPNFLTLNFQDSSTGTPTSWSWDFGDSTTSILQNPSHTYSTSGTYIVKLIATNTDGSSSLQRSFIISTSPVLPITISQLISIKLPGGISINEEAKQAYIATWQLYIQPLVSPEVSFNNVFNETAYPPLANALIAYLAAYSISIDLASQGAISGAAGGANGNSAVVKKIVTGPSEAEFQDISNIQKAVFARDNGVISALSQELCSLAYRLMISLPMCPPLPDPKFIELKAGRNTHKLWTDWPSYIKLSL
jgi:PKD repeat protein